MHDHDVLAGQIAGLTAAIGVLLDEKTTQSLRHILVLTTKTDSEELEDRLTSETARLAFRETLRRLVASSAYYDAASMRNVED